MNEEMEALQKKWHSRSCPITERKKASWMSMGVQGECNTPNYTLVVL